MSEPSLTGQSDSRLRVDGAALRHGSLELSLHGYRNPRAQLNDREGWHVALSEADLRWLQDVIPDALDGIAVMRREYATWDATMPEQRSLSGESGVADWLVREVGLQIHVHDEPWPSAWMCGRCPYMNVGPICTKCGAPRYEARQDFIR